MASCVNFSRRERKMRVVSMCVLLCIPLCGTAGNDILGLNIPREPTLDPNTVCKTYPYLTTGQYHLCSKYPDVTASAIQGVQIAVHECQYQFRAHRWNCSTLETKNKNPHSSPLMSKGFRETAFAYALTSSGVTTQVARACSMGKLSSCGCDAPPVIHPNSNMRYKNLEHWRWRGCSHNMDFGERFARKFLDSKEKAKDLQSQVNLHNNRAGRLIVRKHVETKCKCHGMSGSCELKTCWKAAPPFREVGTMLKKKYYFASKVDNANSVKGRLRVVNRLRGRKRKRPHNTDLVYYVKSPNFCERDASIDSVGTHGRFCNRTSTYIDNCETLCCGRGYSILKVRRVERCFCRFHWCCYVTCKKCTFDDWVTVCK